MVVKYYCLTKSHHDTGGRLGHFFSYQYGLVTFVFVEVIVTTQATNVQA